MSLLDGGPVLFRDVAAESGVTFTHTNGASPSKHIVETMGSGGLLFDYDGDGWLDVFLVDGGSVVDPRAAAQARSRLFHNRRDGTFDDVTAASKIEHHAYGMGACAADYDNDGHEDLYLTNFGANALYRNNGDGTFSDVTRTAGVGGSALSTSCAFADIDNDGRLDLFVTNYVDPEDNSKTCGDSRVRAYCRPDVYNGAASVLYRNNGDGTFSDVTRASGVYRTDGKGLGVVFGDYDDDGRVDFFVANDLVPNFLFHNEGRGSFREVGLSAGVAVASDGRARAGMGTDFGDYDGDGRLDLAVTNFEMETHNLYRNLGGGLFADATLASGMAAATLRFLGFGAVFLDYDNDGSLDLAIANGHVLDNTSHFQSASRYAQRKLLLHNDGRGRFTDVAASAGAGFRARKGQPHHRRGRHRQRRRPRSARDQQRPGREPPAQRGRQSRQRRARPVDRPREQPRRDRRARARDRGRAQPDSRDQGRVELPGAERSSRALRRRRRQGDRPSRGAVAQRAS